MLLNRLGASRPRLSRIGDGLRKIVRLISTFATSRGITAPRMQPISRSVISRRAPALPRSWSHLTAPSCAIGGQP
jgi:hypothetical protein